MTSEVHIKYKHALFVNPYIEKNATNAMMLFPPTGLEYVATSARTATEKVTLLDLRYEPRFSNTDTFNDFIRENKVDIICVGVGWDRQYDQICLFLKQIPEDMTLIIGGYTATEKVEEFLKACPSIDILVRGEGEETIQDILRGMRPKDILGISYLRNGEIVHNPNRPLPDVNSLSRPDRSLRRHDYSLSINGVRLRSWNFDTVLSARGCPFDCKFCTFSLNPLGQKRNYSARSVNSVVEEIGGIQAGIIMFSDDNFFTDPKRAEEICDRLIAQKIKKRFFAQARIDIARYPSLLGKMVQAGFKALLIGIESPHDWILRQLNKGFDQKTIRKSFEILRKYPFFINGYFIYGNIGEEEKEMLYISQFAKEIGVDSISCNKLRIEKFSPLKELAQKSSGYHVTDRGELYSDKYSHAKLKKIGKKIRFSFYTPGRYVKILWKNIFIVKFFTLTEIISLFMAAPAIIISALLKEQRQGRLFESLRRTFIKNT